MYSGILSGMYCIVYYAMCKVVKCIMRKVGLEHSIQWSLFLMILYYREGEIQLNNNQQCYIPVHQKVEQFLPL